jgi:serine/threonine-protein kinase RsbW
MGFKNMAQTQHPLTLTPRSSQSSPFVELQQCLASQVTAISPFLDQFMRFLKSFVNSFGEVRGTEADIEIALRQALANAVIHGNREDIQKRVYVTSRCSMDGEVSITVRDEGQGFDRCELQDRTDPNEGLLSHRWGIYLMQAFMDDVYFEENGRIVHMRKRLRRPLPM